MRSGLSANEQVPGLWTEVAGPWIGSSLYTKDEKVYYHEGAYESMSNTTDYIYIDSNGALQIDDTYSSDNGPYWYRITVM